MRNRSSKRIETDAFKSGIFFWRICFLALVCCGCTTIYNPATERKEFVFIDTQSEVAIGGSLDKQVRKKFEITGEPSINYRLNAIGGKVAAKSDRTDLAYHFYIIKDKDLNAFALPGGFIYVNSALLDRASDDELACVLAHEIGHVAARHSAKRLETNLGYQIVTGIALGLSGKEDLGRAMNVVFDTVSLGYSRSDENLADSLSVRYARRAGFDPHGMLTFFQKLKQDSLGKGVPLVFLSSHPPLEQRIENVKNEIARLEQ
jgi:predicted Zn-dependent protease